MNPAYEEANCQALNFYEEAEYLTLSSRHLHMMWANKRNCHTPAIIINLIFSFVFCMQEVLHLFQQTLHIEWQISLDPYFVMLGRYLVETLIIIGKNMK
jgi:hypothetical protein